MKGNEWIDGGMNESTKGWIYEFNRFIMNEKKDEKMNLLVDVFI